MMQWLDQYSAVLTWLGGISLVAFLATLIAIPWLVARIPQNYFTSPPKQAPQDGAGRWIVIFFKNILGLIFVVAGILMLVLPGQGILTIVLGLSLLDFPAKRRFILWLVSHPIVYRSLDWLRRKTGSEPLDLPR